MSVQRVVALLALRALCALALLWSWGAPGGQTDAEPFALGTSGVEAPEP